MRFFNKVLFIGIVLVGILNANGPASIETAIGIGCGILVGKNPEMALPSNFGWNVSAGASLDIPVSERFSLLTGLDLDYLDFRSKIKMTSGTEAFEKKRYRDHPRPKYSRLDSGKIRQEVFCKRRNRSEFQHSIQAEKIF